MMLKHIYILQFIITNFFSFYHFATIICRGKKKNLECLHLTFLYIGLSREKKKSGAGGFLLISETMESAGFVRWTCCFKTGDVNFALLMLDYITKIFITYALSHFLDNFPYRIGCKVIWNGLKMY